MKQFILACTILFLCVSCSDNAFKIEGQIQGANQEMLYLEAEGVGSNSIIDSVRIKKNGKFKIKQLRSQYPNLYRLRLGKNNIVIAVDSTETIKIDGNIKNYATNFTVENSLATSHIRDLRVSSFELQQIAKDADSVQVNQAIKKHQQLAKNIIMENPRSLAAYYAIYQTINGCYFLSPYESSELPFWSAVATQFQLFYPDYERTKQLTTTTLNAMRMKRRDSQINSTDIMVKETGFIEIDLPNRVGDHIKLSSLIGQVILIDFSAYAMEQASAHTLFLRELYARYHDQGLTIYQISVDPNKLLWMEQTQNIPWITVRDNAAQNSRYLLSYNVSQLPTFFLIDRSGNIVGRYQYDQLDNVILEHL